MEEEGEKKTGKGERAQVGGRGCCNFKKGSQERL